MTWQCQVISSHVIDLVPWNIPVSTPEALTSILINLYPIQKEFYIRCISVSRVPSDMRYTKSGSAKCASSRSSSIVEDVTGLSTVNISPGSGHCLPCLNSRAKLYRVRSFWWLSARLQYLQCVSNGDTAAGLDTNGCPLGNSKFILLSDNLNICLWLSACQVEKIDQMNNPWSTIY